MSFPQYNWKYNSSSAFFFSAIHSLWDDASGLAWDIRTLPVGWQAKGNASSHITLQLFQKSAGYIMLYVSNNTYFTPIMYFILKIKFICVHSEVYECKCKCFMWKVHQPLAQPPTWTARTFYFGKKLNWSFTKYEDNLKSSWTDGSVPLLCRGMRWLLCQVVVVGTT